MTLELCFDHILPDGSGYPNLAQSDLPIADLDQHWPRTVALRLLQYLELGGFRARCWGVADAPRGAWYAVGLAWFDFDCDYFGLMTAELLHRLRQRELAVLFYYHEGDNPSRIKQRLDLCCRTHDLPQDCYAFISANSAARDLSRFCYFDDHEFFFRRINRHQTAPLPSQEPRPFRFTALNRTHKWWRATIMTDLLQQGLLEHCAWSYNTGCEIDDQWHDNPLELSAVGVSPDDVRAFMAQGPYHADSSDHVQHNDHRRVPLDLYQRSYCHIVIETHLDADQSHGVFLTEKTYKCLKFGQPFVLLGTAGSVQQLRQHGYSVYDDVIDHGYDEIADVTQRYLAARQSIQKLATQDLGRLFGSIAQDIVANQNHFLQRGPDDLYQLLTWLDQLHTRTP